MPQGPKKWAGKIVGIVGDVLTGEQIAAAFSEAAGGKPFRYVSLPDEVYLGALKGAGLPEAAAKDLTNMFAYYRWVALAVEDQSCDHFVRVVRF